MQRIEERDDRLADSENRLHALLVRGLGGDAAETKKDLNQVLAGLPDRQRLPMVHVKLPGLSVVEAAQFTGMWESAIKSGVHRGLKALAARIRGTA